VADQLYAFYARGRDARKLIAIIGEEGLSGLDKKYLRFADEFEKRFVSQEGEDRSISRTLDIGWKLLSMIPKTEFTRIKEEFITGHYSRGD